MPEPAANREPNIIDERSISAKQQYRTAGLLVTLSAIVLFYGLGRLPLLGPDEPRYAEVAREMLVSRDFVTPRLCGCPWFEKPALLYWMAAAAYEIFGVDEFAARLPSAMAAILTVLFLNYVIARSVNTVAALSSSVVLLTTPLFAGFGRAAVTDMPLAWATTTALLLLLLAINAQGGRATGLWVGAWAMTGVAVLAKGLVGIVMFVAIGGAAYLIGRTSRLPSARRLVFGVAVCLMVAAVWYAPVILKHGQAFTTEFFINHHFKRYLTNEYHHPEPLYFYPAVVVLGIVPWPAYLVPALARFRDQARQQQAPARFMHWLVWCWLVIPIAFFSLSESKLPGYVLPAIPAVAVIVGLELKRVWDGESAATLRIAGYATAVIAILIGAGVIVYVRSQFPGQRGLAAVLEYLPLGFAVGAAAALLAGRPRAFLIGAAGVVPSAILAGLILLSPQLSESLSMKRLSVEAADDLRPGERIAFFIDREYAPVFYARGQVLCGGKANDVLNAMSLDELVSALQSYPSLIVITEPQWLSALTGDSRIRLQPVAQQRDQMAFRVERAAQ